MNDKKINITISIDRNLYHRIEDAVNYLNLSKIYEKEDIVVGDINDFIVGSVINFLRYVELFSYSHNCHPHLINQDKRLIKNKLKEYLKKHNIKQTDLSNATGVDKGNLSGMLRNHTQPSLDSFLKIWAALDYPPLDELFYREDEYEE